ncbi:MAG: hypothetical protein HC941_26875 [Microcoleus sp. SU_5_3]|nr:hypothetical protein [Microcoleus sp. SU_5_3]
MAKLISVSPFGLSLLLLTGSQIRSPQTINYRVASFQKVINNNMKNIMLDRPVAPL